jgi:hypothetical protein
MDRALRREARRGGVLACCRRAVHEWRLAEFRQLVDAGDTLARAGVVFLRTSLPVAAAPGRSHTPWIGALRSRTLRCARGLENFARSRAAAPRKRPAYAPGNARAQWWCPNAISYEVLPRLEPMTDGTSPSAPIPDVLDGASLGAPDTGSDDGMTSVAADRQETRARDGDHHRRPLLGLKGEMFRHRRSRGNWDAGRQGEHARGHGDAAGDSVTRPRAARCFASTTRSPPWGVHRSRPAHGGDGLPSGRHARAQREHRAAPHAPVLY